MNDVDNITEMIFNKLQTDTNSLFLQLNEFYVPNECMQFDTIINKIQMQVNEQLRLIRVSLCSQRANHTLPQLINMHEDP